MIPSSPLICGALFRWVCRTHPEMNFDKMRFGSAPWSLFVVGNSETQSVLKNSCAIWSRKQLKFLKENRYSTKGKLRIRDKPEKKRNTNMKAREGLPQCKDPKMDMYMRERNIGNTARQNKQKSRQDVLGVNSVTLSWHSELFGFVFSVSATDGHCSPLIWWHDNRWNQRHFALYLHSTAAKGAISCHLKRK